MQWFVTRQAKLSANVYIMSTDIILSQRLQVYIIT